MELLFLLMFLGGAAMLAYGNLKNWKSTLGGHHRRTFRVFVPHIPIMVRSSPGRRPAGYSFIRYLCTISMQFLKNSAN